jgi:hypothetical protein
MRYKNMKRPGLNLFLLLLITLGACNPPNLLRLKHRLFYSEDNCIEANRSTLRQRINYNQPGTVDEEFSHELTFKFLDTALAKQRKG